MGQSILETFSTSTSEAIAKLQENIERDHLFLKTMAEMVKEAELRLEQAEADTLKATYTVEEATELSLDFYQSALNGIIESSAMIEENKTLSDAQQGGGEGYEITMRMADYGATNANNPNRVTATSTQAQEDESTQNSNTAAPAA